MEVKIEQKIQKYFKKKFHRDVILVISKYFYEETFVERMLNAPASRLH